MTEEWWLKRTQRMRNPTQVSDSTGRIPNYAILSSEPIFISMLSAMNLQLKMKPRQQIVDGKAKGHVNYFISWDPWLSPAILNQFPKSLPTWAVHPLFLWKPSRNYPLYPWLLLRVDIRNGLQRNVPALWNHSLWCQLLWGSVCPLQVVR